MDHLPPLPAEYAPVFYETLEKVKGIAARVKEQIKEEMYQQQQQQQQQQELSRPSGSRVNVYTMIPGHRAGLVIGGRGENLKRIEKMAQVKLQFDQQWVGPSGEKRIQVTGLPEDVEEAIKLVREKAEEPDSRYPSVHLTVPSHRVGLLIGKGGETIRELQEKSGAKITIAPDGGQDTVTGERPVNITGDQEAIRKAREMIDELVTHGTRPSMLSGGSTSANRNTLTIQIPENCVGAIIGKRAETIKSFQSMSQAKIFVEPTLQPGMTQRVVHLSGAPESVGYARQLIEEKVRQIEGINSMGQSGYQSYETMQQPAVIYQAPGDFSSTLSPTGADPSAAGYDYSQYYQQYYQQAAAYNQYYGYQQQQPAQGDPSQQPAAFDYAAYAAQYAAAQQQQMDYPPS